MFMATIVGLTGGIGSGKSTVAAMLSDRGAVVIDADRTAHEVYAAGSEGFDAVVERFGRSVVGADGEIDRMVLGSVVFNDRQALQDLNAIIHPLVRTEVARRVAAAIDEDPDAVIVIEAALMTETGWAGGSGTMWVVITEPDIAVARLVEYRGMEEAEARLRMSTQADNATRRRHADQVIENNGSIDDLEAEVNAAWLRLQESIEAATG